MGCKRKDTVKLIMICFLFWEQQRSSEETNSKKLCSCSRGKCHCCLVYIYIHAAAGPLPLRWYGNTKGRQMVVMIQTQKCATNSIAFLPASSRVSSTRISDLTAGANDSILSYVSMERRKFVFSQSQWSHFSRTKFQPVSSSLNKKFMMTDACRMLNVLCIL